LSVSSITRTNSAGASDASAWPAFGTDRSVDPGIARVRARATRRRGALLRSPKVHTTGCSIYADDYTLLTGLGHVRGKAD